MRMSDWSSDVCSSDLRRQRRPSVRRTDRKGHHAPGDRGSRQFPPRGRGMTRRAILKGTGSALPRKRVSNAELAQRVDTSDEWIGERTDRKSVVEGKGGSVRLGRGGCGERKKKQ